MKKNKPEKPANIRPILDEDHRDAAAHAAALGHTLGDFKKNGDICIAMCTRCKGAAIIHEDTRPNGRHSGTATGFRCTE